jgi:ribosomal protein L11 methyltransferase
MSEFAVVEVHFEHLSDYENYFLELSQLSQEYSCDGIEEFNILEIEVDGILGEKSYCGGDMIEEIQEELEEAIFNKKNDHQEIKIKFYFYTEMALGMAPLFYGKIEELGFKGSYTKQENQDWNESWKKGFAPFYITPSLEIIPSWVKETYVSKAKNSLYINPAMAFGTGHHETTSLCLEVFEDLHGSIKNLESERAGKEIRILDFGCGSGILGLGAKYFLQNLNLEIDFIDIEDESIRNTQENIELNFPGENKKKLNVSYEKNKLQKYDIIFANILEGILIQEKEFLLNGLNKNGLLILSGILDYQVENILRNFPLHLLAQKNKNQWVVLGFQHK